MTKKEFVKLIKHGEIDDTKEAWEHIYDLIFTEGRISVLRDFDSLCQADAFVGFPDQEWKAIKRFFEMNKRVSGWDRKDRSQKLLRK